ncbi:peptidylprolyl isomerase [Woodsholea maritima]|uniref:peptidylprolyl isomerase n=1 Tax=Woodsholea maritima TaxID=240237 RepID=UPI0003808244|nr:peptidylprolyl isomerase [Woodsholea maritima]
MVVSLILSVGLALSAVQTDASEADWRDVAPENLILMETNHGPVAIELAPHFAPLHAQRMRDLAHAGFYDGLSFYRVIEGFVAQAGREEGPLPDWPALPLETERESAGLSFVPLGNDDLYAPHVGHVDGFPAAQSEDGAQSWLIHCPGSVGMARDPEPQTGDAEFYIVLGQGPRYLDRNYTVFGRVIDGMDALQALHRGDRAIEGGVIQDPALRDPILSVRLVADLPEAERAHYQVMTTEGEAFDTYKTMRRVRTAEAFVVTPPEVIEACHVPGPVRRVD